MDFYPGYILDVGGTKYKLERYLGEGVTAIVYLASEQATQKQFAIKILRSDAGQETREAFFGENLILGELISEGITNVPRIVASKIAENPGEATFLIQEYVNPDEYIPLDRYLDQKVRLSEIEVLSIAVPALELLKILHEKVQRTYVDMQLKNFCWLSNPEMPLTRPRLIVMDWNHVSPTQKALEENPGAFSQLLRVWGASTFDDLVNRDLLTLASYLYLLLTGKAYSPTDTAWVLEQRAGEVWKKTSLATRQLLLRALDNRPAFRYACAAEFLEQVSDTLNLIRPWEPHDGDRYIDELMGCVEKWESKDPDVNMQDRAKVGDRARIVLDAIVRHPGVFNEGEIERFQKRLGASSGSVSGEWAIGQRYYDQAYYAEAAERWEREANRLGNPALWRWVVAAKAASKIGSQYNPLKSDVQKLIDALEQNHFPDIIHQKERLSTPHYPGLDPLLQEAYITHISIEAQQKEASNEIKDWSTAVQYYTNAQTTFEMLPTDWRAPLAALHGWPDFSLKVQQLIQQIAVRQAASTELETLRTMLDPNQPDKSASEFSAKLKLDPTNPAYWDLVRDFCSHNPDDLLSRRLLEVYERHGQAAPQEEWQNSVAKILIPALTTQIKLAIENCHWQILSDLVRRLQRLTQRDQTTEVERLLESEFAKLVKAKNIDANFVHEALLILTNDPKNRQDELNKMDENSKPDLLRSSIDTCIVQIRAKALAGDRIDDLSSFVSEKARELELNYQDIPDYSDQIKRLQDELALWIAYIERMKETTEADDEIGINYVKILNAIGEVISPDEISGDPKIQALAFSEKNPARLPTGIHKARELLTETRQKVAELPLFMQQIHLERLRDCEQMIKIVEASGLVDKLKSAWISFAHVKLALDERLKGAPGANPLPDDFEMRFAEAGKNIEAANTAKKQVSAALNLNKLSLFRLSQPFFASIDRLNKQWEDAQTMLPLSGTTSKSRGAVFLGFLTKLIAGFKPWVPWLALVIALLALIFSLSNPVLPPPPTPTPTATPTPTPTPIVSPPPPTEVPTPLCVPTVQLQPVDDGAAGYFQIPTLELVPNGCSILLGEDGRLLLDGEPLVVSIDGVETAGSFQKSSENWSWTPTDPLALPPGEHNLEIQDLTTAPMPFTIISPPCTLEFDFAPEEADQYSLNDTPIFYDLPPIRLIQDCQLTPEQIQSIQVIAQNTTNTVPQSGSWSVAAPWLWMPGGPSLVSELALEPGSYTISLTYDAYTSNSLPLDIQAVNVTATLDNATGLPLIDLSFDGKSLISEAEQQEIKNTFCPNDNCNVQILGLLPLVPPQPFCIASCSDWFQGSEKARGTACELCGTNIFPFFDLRLRLVNESGQVYRQTYWGRTYTTTLSPTACPISPNLTPTPGDTLVGYYWNCDVYKAFPNVIPTNK